MSRLTSRRSPDWRTAAFELALIVVAILTALAVDAWWQYRNDRALERDYIAALRSDLVENRDRLTRLIARGRQTIDAGDALHRRISDDISDDDSAAVNELLLRFYSVDLFAPVTGTYDELIASGRLLLLRDPDLRLALAQYHRQLNTVELGEKLLVDSWREAQVPFLRDHTLLTSLRPSPGSDSVAPFPAGLAALQSRAFWNRVAEWSFAKRDLVTIYEGMLERNDDLIERLDAGSSGRLPP